MDRDRSLCADEFNERTEKMERVPLMDTQGDRGGSSPYHCVISPGAASPQTSFVDGWSKETRTVDTHKQSKVLEEMNDVPFSSLPHPPSPSLAFPHLRSPSLIFPLLL